MHRLASTILALALFVFAPILCAEPLDINTATAEQLAETMVGVGKVKAQAIVQDRDKNGRFKSIDDLARVKGIGSATIEKNRGKITVGAETPPQPTASAGHSAAPSTAAHVGQPATPPSGASTSTK
jgi:competence protein ComEA